MVCLVNVGLHRNLICVQSHCKKNIYNYLPTYATGLSTMNTINYSTLCNNLASVLDKVNDDHVSVLVTRKKGKRAVILSLEDYNAYQEVARLMACPFKGIR